MRLQTIPIRVGIHENHYIVNKSCISDILFFDSFFLFKIPLLYRILEDFCDCSEEEAYRQKYSYYSTLFSDLWDNCPRMVWNCTLGFLFGYEDVNYLIISNQYYKLLWAEMESFARWSWITPSDCNLISPNVSLLTSVLIWGFGSSWSWSVDWWLL